MSSLCFPFYRVPQQSTRKGYSHHPEMKKERTDCCHDSDMNETKHQSGLSDGGDMDLNATYIK